MQLTIEHYLTLGLVLGLVVFLMVRRRTSGKQRSERVASSAPGNLHYVCAGCEGHFTHTKRTIRAWQTGTRRFFCNDCHGKWRNSHPARVQIQKGVPASQQVQNVASASSEKVRSEALAAPAVGRHSRPDSSRSGCLGTTVLLIGVPVILVILAVQYA